METFYYCAVNQVGRQEKGRMDAFNIADLEVRLQKIGLDLTTVKPASKTNHFFSNAKTTKAELALFCFQLEQLINAGVPILEGISDLRESAENMPFKTILGIMLTELEGGKMLSEAMAAHSDVFDSVFINLIAAGEQSGQLPTVLHHLSNTLKWQDELSAQVKRLLAYPIFIFMTVTLAIAFLMIFLVPKLVQLMMDLGQELPWSTQLLVFTSNLFVYYWWLLICVPMLTVLAVVTLVKHSTKARYQLDAAKLKLPVFGRALNKVMMARFSRYFALMYRAGIPILSAIKTCENIVGNQVVAQALHTVHDNISAGQSMSVSFQQTGLFPSLVIRMVAVGERSGALDDSLMNVSYFYDRDVNALLQNMLKVLEPTLTVVLGLVLMFVMAAVLGPVYNVFSQMPL